MDMVNDLVKVFPNDSEFLFYQMALRAATFAKPEAINRIFHKSIQDQMDEKILVCDETFFLEKDFSQYKSSKRDVSMIVHKLKHTWQSLQPDNKRTVWKYLKILVLLDRKIHA